MPRLACGTRRIKPSRSRAESSWWTVAGETRPNCSRISAIVGAYCFASMNRRTKSYTCFCRGVKTIVAPHTKQPGTKVPGQIHSAANPAGRALGAKRAGPAATAGLGCHCSSPLADQPFHVITKDVDVASQSYEFSSVFGSPSLNPAYFDSIQENLVVPAPAAKGLNPATWRYRYV